MPVAIHVAYLLVVDRIGEKDWLNLSDAARAGMIETELCVMDAEHVAVGQVHHPIAHKQKLSSSFV